MGSIEQNIKNFISTKGIPYVKTNAPLQYLGLQKQYLSEPSRQFINDYAKYSADFFQAEAQGLNINDFFTFYPVFIRLADSLSTTSSNVLTEDYKQVLFANKSIVYFGLGAYLKAGGNTYININPTNISTTTTNALVRRCNTTWNFYDYYGNIIQMPMAWDKSGALGTQNKWREIMPLMSAYQHAHIQYNAQTQWITENSRVILGNQAYAVTGIVNFTQEFTDDPNSTHLITFDLYRVETTDNDDLTNKIADAKAFSWEIVISGSEQMTEGSTQNLTAISRRNGEEIQNTEQHPIAYSWESSNTEILTVDSNGQVNAVGEGSAYITCSLLQNKNITSRIMIEVSENISSEYIEMENVPAELTQYNSVEINAVYYINGIAQNTPLVFEYSGAPTNCYGIQQAGNTLAVTCYFPSYEPLTITAKNGNIFKSVTISLIGY